MTSETEKFGSTYIEAPDEADAKAPTKRKFEDLPPAAQRALKEAQARREQSHITDELPKEVYGRGGLEPTRYNDWEVKGITSDF